jgi:hypothetical protein
LGLLIAPSSGTPLDPATFSELGVAFVLRSVSVTTVPCSEPFGAIAYAAEANVPSTSVTLDQLIVKVAPAATEVG